MQKMWLQILQKMLPVLGNWVSNLQWSAWSLCEKQWIWWISKWKWKQWRPWHNCNSHWSKKHWWFLCKHFHEFFQFFWQDLGQSHFENHTELVPEQGNLLEGIDILLGLAWLWNHNKVMLSKMTLFMYLLQFPLHCLISWDKSICKQIETPYLLRGHKT